MALLKNRNRSGFASAIAENKRRLDGHPLLEQKEIQDRAAVCMTAQMAMRLVESKRQNITLGQR